MASAPAWQPPAAARCCPAAGDRAAKNFPPDRLPMMAAQPVLARLKKRADFLAAARSVRKVAGSITLEFAPTPQPACQDGALRLGFTASRKVGNAVARNRAKRRMRAAAAQTLPLLGRPGHDYVLVARASVLTCDFAVLTGDLATALGWAHRALDERLAKGA